MSTVTETWHETEPTREEKLAVYFVYHKVMERFGKTFPQFTEMVNNGTWKQFVEERQLPVGR